MHLFADPEFWVLLATIVFVALVWRPAKRSLIGGLDQRAARIRVELDEARQLREEAQQMLAEYRSKQQQAAAEAQAILAHARAEAERVAAQSARDLEQSLERRRQMAEDRIAQAEAQALREIRSTAIDVAIGAARRVIGSELDQRRGAELIDAAITALPQQLH